MVVAGAGEWNTGMATAWHVVSSVRDTPTPVTTPGRSTRASTEGAGPRQKVSEAHSARARSDHAPPRCRARRTTRGSAQISCAQGDWLRDLEAMTISIGLFFGGRSVEHEVSVISALQASEALDHKKYSVLPVYISKDGLLYAGKRLLDIDGYRDMDSLLAACHRVALVNDGSGVLVVRYPPRILRSNVIGRVDVAFPIVHGTNAEDGTIQGYLALLGIPYVGSDITASAIGMDKVLSKRLLRECGLPVVDWVDFFADGWHDSDAAIIERVTAELGEAVVVKPSSCGSSIGVMKVAAPDALRSAIDTALAFSQHILVEKAVPNMREVNCAVLGDRSSVEVSECEEPLGGRADEILSFADKYLHKSSSSGMKGGARELPANLSPDTRETIRSYAEKAFRCLGCSGVARVDFLLDEDSGRVYLNELNTIPGSLSFYLWEATGMSFAELTERLIGLALKRHRERSRLTFTYDTNIFALQGDKMRAKL